MGRGDLIGNGDQHLIPSWTSTEAGGMAAGERRRETAGPGTPDKFKPGFGSGAGKSRVALGGTAAAPKASMAESKIRPSILSTIKTKAKPAAKPARNAGPGLGRSGRK